ncbi:MAG: hypothetical protein ACJ8FY_28235 [Gemmataceae bacterium]
MRLTAAVFVIVAGLVGAARADDKASLTGTWKWTVTNGEQKRDVTLRLKQDGDKLTGAILNRNSRETNIEDGTVKDGEVSFKVTRERNGQKSTSKYTGKVSGDMIKGKIESERDGKAESRDWEAKRQKD